jgi:hypothetical protein
MIGIVCSLVTLLPAVAPPGTPPAVLVAQLGSDEFAQRQAAQRGLEGWGVAALPAIEAALDRADLEQYRRIRRLLRHLYAEKAAVQSMQLHKGQVPERTGLWDHFRRATGDGPAARYLFATLYALEGAAFEEVDLAIRRREWDEVRTAINALCDRHCPPATLKTQHERRRGYWPEPTPHLMLLFLSGLPGARLGDPQYERLFGDLLQRYDLQSSAQMKDEDARVLQLLGHASAARQSGARRTDPLWLLLVWESPGPGVALARSRLRGPSSPREKTLAACYLGWYGEPGDVGLILPLLEMKAPYPGVVDGVQIRDLALLAVIRATKIDRKDLPQVGELPPILRRPILFWRLEEISANIPSRPHPVFETDEEREAAFAAWRKWVAANPDKLPAMRK